MSEPGALYGVVKDPLLKRVIKYLKRQGNEFAADPAGYLESSARAALPPDPLGGYNAQGVPQMNPEATKWLADNVGFGAITVYHGSPYKFGAFDMSKVGDAGGGSSWGHGIYFADAPEVPSKIYTRGKDGFTYKADIPDEAVDSFLMWDDPIVAQPQTVKDAFAGTAMLSEIPPDGVRLGDSARILPNLDGSSFPDIWNPYALKTDSGVVFGLSKKEVERLITGDSGGAAYRQLSANLGSEKAASEFLKLRGVGGARYKGNPRSEGNNSFVLFDDRLPRILERNGVPTGNKPWEKGEMDRLIKALKQ